MSDSGGADRQTDQAVQAFLASVGDLRKQEFRWRIWTGRPLVGGASDVAAARVARLQAYPFPQNVLLLVSHFLIAVTLSLVLWAMIPFSMIWWAGWLTGHSWTYLVLISTVLLVAILMVAFITWSLFMNRFPAMEERLIAVRATLAAVALPTLMYITAAGLLTEFKPFERPPDNTPAPQIQPTEPIPEGLEAYTLWASFYGYMYADIITLGSLESLVGSFSSLQPSSWKSMLFTFLTHTLISISVLYHAYRYLHRRVFATEEFSGTLPGLLHRLNEAAVKGVPCYAVPVAYEVTMPPLDPLPAPALFDLSKRDGWLTVYPEFRSALWGFLRSGVFLQIASAVFITFALLLGLVPLPAGALAILMAVLIVSVLIGILLPALSRARRTSDHVACISQLKQLGQACAMYAAEHGEQLPSSLAELLDHFPELERSAVCPIVRRGHDMNRPDNIPTRRQILDLTGYTYVGGGRKLSQLGRSPLFYEAPTAHDGRGNVLYGDGHVEWLNPAQFEALVRSMPDLSPVPPAAKAPDV